MPELNRQDADWTGKLTIRLEDFPDEQAARTYLATALKPGLARQFEDATVERDGTAFVFSRGICHFTGGPPLYKPYTATCTGTGPCIPVD